MSEARVWTERQLLLGVLALLEQQGRKNKWNLIGRPLQRGDLELMLNGQFDEVTRARCARAFDALQRADLIRADFGDTADPASWVAITDRGRGALGSGALDALDEELLGMDPRFVEMRAGISDALASNGPDSLRHACDSAWELLSQVLKNSVSDEEVKDAPWFTPNRNGEAEITRAHRARLIMERRFGVADENACDALGAVARRLAKLKHPRETLERGQVELVIRQAEDALRSVLLSPSRQGVD